jgi:diadenosine tetraphosphate (Ap4A) HIT family hydrolase
MSNASHAVRRLAFDVARRIGKRDIATHLFCICEPILPLTRLQRSAGAVAFLHPRPSWPGHALVTPTRRCPALLTPRWPIASRAAALWATIELAERVAGDDGSDFRYLIVNGGERQDVGQLHGHLTGSLERAGFAGPADPGGDPERYVAFDGVSRSPAGVEDWLRALEAHQRQWPRPDAGFSAIFPLQRSGAMTIYLDIADAS